MSGFNFRLYPRGRRRHRQRSRTAVPDWSVGDEFFNSYRAFVVTPVELAEPGSE